MQKKHQELRNLNVTSKTFLTPNAADSKTVYSNNNDKNRVSLLNLKCSLKALRRIYLSNIKRHFGFVTIKPRQQLTNNRKWQNDGSFRDFYAPLGGSGCEPPCTSTFVFAGGVQKRLLSGPPQTSD